MSFLGSGLQFPKQEEKQSQKYQMLLCEPTGHQFALKGLKSLIFLFC